MHKSHICIPNRAIFCSSCSNYFSFVLVCMHALAHLLGLRREYAHTRRLIVPPTISHWQNTFSLLLQQILAFCNSPWRLLALGRRVRDAKKPSHSDLHLRREGTFSFRVPLSFVSIQRWNREVYYVFQLPTSKLFTVLSFANKEVYKQGNVSVGVLMSRQGIFNPFGVFYRIT